MWFCYDNNGVVFYFASYFIYPFSDGSYCSCPLGDGVRLRPVLDRILLHFIMFWIQNMMMWVGSSQVRSESYTWDSSGTCFGLGPVRILLGLSLVWSVFSCTEVIIGACGGLRHKCPAQARLGLKI